MPLYDYHCPSCDVDLEHFAPMADRRNQKCPTCGAPLGAPIPKPQPRYVPFHPYFDEGLGVFVTGRNHRRRVMREFNCDFRDHPSRGDESARVDKAYENKKARDQAR